MVYAVVDQSRVVVNRVEWDGVTPWSEPLGRLVVQDTNNESWIGGTWDGSKFSPRPLPAPTTAASQEEIERSAMQLQAYADAARKLGLVQKANDMEAKARGLLGI